MTLANQYQLTLYTIGWRVHHVHQTAGEHRGKRLCLHADVVFCLKEVFSGSYKHAGVWFYNNFYQLWQLVKVCTEKGNRFEVLLTLNSYGEMIQVMQRVKHACKRHLKMYDTDHQFYKWYAQKYCTWPSGKNNKRSLLWGKKWSDSRDENQEPWTSRFHVHAIYFFIHRRPMDKQVQRVKKECKPRFLLTHTTKCLICHCTVCLKWHRSMC